MEPKIRFKGFEGEWIETSLSNLSSNFKYGINAAAVSFDGENKYLRITDIDDTMHSFLQNDVTSPGTDLSCCDEYLMQDGDIVIARTGASVGKSYIYHPFDGKVYFAGFLIRMRLNENTNRDFVFQNTLTNAYAKHVQFVSQRSGQPGINVNELQAYKLRIPSLSEQQFIATYFRTLDNKIQSTSKKLASLKKLKSASLVSMFPQQGETTPKVRFKGFEGEWSKEILGNIAKFSKGQGYSKSDLREDGHPIILYGRMYTKYQFTINNVDTFAYLKEASVFSEGNEIIMPASGETPEDIARASAVLTKGIILGGDLNIMHFDLKKHSTPFIALAITYSNAHYDLSKCAQGKSVVHLHNEAISKATITLPSYEEQQAIATFFRSLDRKIALETARLEKLKQIKLACLDKMFV